MRVENLPSKNIDEYTRFYSVQEINHLKEMSSRIGDHSITHVNSTSIGGGVAEILYGLVPIMNSVGINARWEVIRGDDEFFRITKKIHNALQGAKLDLASWEVQKYLDVNKWNALNEVSLESDIVIIHDPQPLPLRKYVGDGRLWVWRCHIDLSTPYKPVWDFIRGMLQQYHASIYHMREYIHPDTPTPLKFVMPPSIDPLSPKNMELSRSRVLEVLSRYDVDPEKPILLQVARFDPWKDPFAAIDTYRIMKEKIPGIQLLLVTAMASDDPEGWEYYEKAARYAGTDYNIHLLTNLKGVGAMEVNAFQRAATIVLQLSKREGFGLAVTEAMWKEKPVIVRPRGGLRIQVRNGVNGYYAETPLEAADKAVYLIRHPEIRDRMGREGRRIVLERFTIVKHLENYLHILWEALKHNRSIE